MPAAIRRVVVVGTGGTIAGVAMGGGDGGGDGLLGYRAGALTVGQLLQALPPGAVDPAWLDTATVAQIDSCDMTTAVWTALAQAVAAQLARADVAGVVVTHGTDTLEETAYLLHRVVDARDKPVVLTAAMRPATAPSPDGPQNLLDALRVARADGVVGVLAVLGGRVLAGESLRKVHGWRLDAFDGGDGGPLAVMEDGRLRCLRPWPRADTHAAAGRVLAGVADWPRVEIVTSHAGADGALLRAAVAAGARGVVVAGTGNGSVHRALREAATDAMRAGVVVRRASRCVLGGVVDAVDGVADALPSAGVRTPVQARVELQLDLIAAALPEP